MVLDCARRGESRGMSLLVDVRSAVVASLLTAGATLWGPSLALAQTPTLNNPKISVTTATNTPVNVAVSATAHPADPSFCTPNLTFSISQPPGHGTASVFSQSATAGTAVLRYVPGPGFSGLDAFQYTVTEADIPETVGIACGVGQAIGSVSATIFNPATAIPGETIAGRLQPTQDLRPRHRRRRTADTASDRPRPNHQFRSSFGGAAQRSPQSQSLAGEHQRPANVSQRSRRSGDIGKLWIAACEPVADDGTFRPSIGDPIAGSIVYAAVDPDRAGQHEG